MDVYAIAYISTARQRFMSSDTLDRLLAKARQFNALHDVTGALLFHDGTFFQYIEGARDDVMQVYARTQASTLHHNLFLLVNEPAPQRYFEGWRMGFSQPSASAMQALSQADWQLNLDKARMAENKSPGLMLLLDFWKTAQRL